MPSTVWKTGDTKLFIRIHYDILSLSIISFSSLMNGYDNKPKNNMLFLVKYR